MAPTLRIIGQNNFFFLFNCHVLFSLWQKTGDGGRCNKSMQKRSSFDVRFPRHLAFAQFNYLTLTENWPNEMKWFIPSSTAKVKLNPRTPDFQFSTLWCTAVRKKYKCTFIRAVERKWYLVNMDTYKLRLLWFPNFPFLLD